MNKKTLLISFIVMVISSLILVVARHPYSIYAKMIGINNYGNNPKELYRVYVSGKPLGVIESKADLENYIDSKQQELKERYKVKKVYAPSDLKIIKEVTYDEKISTVEEIYDKIEEIFGNSSFTIDGYRINIEGVEKKTEEGTKKSDDIVLYVLDKKIFEKSVKTMVLAFIDGERYDEYLNDTQKELEENKVGSYINKIYIKNNIKITKGRIPAEDNIYTDEVELSKYLLFGTTEEQDTYTVKSGDTISEIADSNKLSVDEFLIANNEFKSADDLLYPGQVVKLALIEPQFDIVEEETINEERKINKETVYKNDDSKYVGYEQVQEQGSDGLALITESRQIVNGEIIETIQTGKVELVPAVNKVVVRGTKKYPVGGVEWEVPVGIGSWVWPTATPYGISSTFGWRWGKLHEGIDINGTGYGSPIKAANNGIVVESGYLNLNGNYILIKHDGNYYTMYAHLASRTKQVGDVVMAGDLIGTMGKSGFATGVHLHFGLYRGYPYRGGYAVNPYTVYN